MKSEWRKSLLVTLIVAMTIGGCGRSMVTSLEQPSAVQEAAEYESQESPDSEIPETRETERDEMGQTMEEIADTQEVPPEPVIQQVKITTVGDCTLGATQTHGYAGSFHEYYDKNGEDYFFSNVKDVFENDDFTLVNLECVLSESTERVEKTWNLKGKPEYVGIMKNSSVEGASLGNNHTLDYGWGGLTDTESVLDDAGIIYGYNEHTATYTTESKLQIGIVSVSLLSQDETRAGYIRDGITRLREQGADIVIASCHWGIEGEHYPNDYQRKMAHQIIDWGADLVAGSHPHVLQGAEIYNGKVILYSMGNFCFGGNRNPADKDTLVYEQTFTFRDGVLDQTINADIIPYRLSGSSSYNDFHPTPAEGEDYERILSNMNDYSRAYSNLEFDSKGKLILREDD